MNYAQGAPAQSYGPPRYLGGYGTPNSSFVGGSPNQDVGPPQVTMAAGNQGESLLEKMRRSLALLAGLPDAPRTQAAQSEASPGGGGIYQQPGNGAGPPGGGAPGPPNWGPPGSEWWRNTANRGRGGGNRIGYTREDPNGLYLWVPPGGEDLPGWGDYVTWAEGMNRMSGWSWPQPDPSYVPPVTSFVGGSPEKDVNPLSFAAGDEYERRRKLAQGGLPDAAGQPPPTGQPPVSGTRDWMGNYQYPRGNYGTYDPMGTGMYKATWGDQAADPNGLPPNYLGGFSRLPRMPLRNNAYETWANFQAARNGQPFPYPGNDFRQGARDDDFLEEVEYNWGPWETDPAYDAPEADWPVY
jgi:hypothetical protein